MKNVIIQLIAAVANGVTTITEPHYHIVGRCLQFKLERAGGGTVANILIDKFGLINCLMDMALINGHDSETHRVKLRTSNGVEWVHLQHIYLDMEQAQRTELYYRCLQDYFTHALAILEHTGSPEELWPYFEDYNTAERSALIWRLWERADIENYEPRFVSENIRHYLDGSLRYMPSATNLRFTLFAKWARDSAPNLLTISPRPVHADGGYVSTVA